MSNEHLPILKQNKSRSKASRKIIITLLLLFIVLFAVLFFRSSISKVKEIQFTGNTYTTSEQLLEQSGLGVGMQFFAVRSSSVEHKLKSLPFISEVKVDKQFPGVITVNITEYPTVAYELTKDGKINAILSSGAAVSVEKSGIAIDKPILTQWNDKDANKVKLCQALSKIPNELTSDISEIIPSPTSSFPDRIKMYTKSRFEVITSISLLKDKIEYLNQITETQQPGVITMLEADSYVPYVAGADAPEDGQNDTTH
ncbi:FtsQ-type POTRA domain-containing protein [Paenibacillus sediminis]|uniref:Cell division protein DivIB n=1 Tax=Paenibacillus sediminis TaxID=664909 RepID=A0ABS4GYW5_9BACL|nr:FtsQ-type POTRA domain-containing protein [Paenibacillus sediminis]MBP1935458.1 cell division protein FtsQ [Paenibacillus sediminis]